MVVVLHHIFIGMCGSDGGGIGVYISLSLGGMIWGPPLGASVLKRSFCSCIRWCG